MGLGPSAAEQEANELDKQRELAKERVARREKLGQQARPEPALGDEVPDESTDLPNVGAAFNEATNDEN